MSSITVETRTEISDIDRESLNKLVSNSASGTIYSTYEHLKAIEKGFPGNPLYFLAKKDSNLIGIIPGRVRTLPLGLTYFTSSQPYRGGPIISTDESKVFNDLFTKVENYFSRRNLYIEISPASVKMVRYSGALKKRNYRTELNSVKMILDMSESIEEIEAGMKSSRRRIFRKKGENLEIIRDPNKKEIINFYQDYQKIQHEDTILDKKIDYFLRLSHFKEDLVLARARKKDSIIGQHLYLIDNENSTINFLLAGMGKNYQKHSAPEEIHAGMIKRFHNDFDRYNFGINQADFQDGIYRFKQQYGAEPIPVPRWIKTTSIIPETVLKAVKLRGRKQ